MLEFKTLLAFAKDAVSCMAYFYTDRWIAPSDKVKSPFKRDMGEAIIRFTLYNREWLDIVAEEVVIRVDEHPEEFFEFGYELADLLIENEPFLELIGICSFITYVAHVFFIMGKRQFMDKAYLMIAILFMKLRNTFEANGGWRSFQQSCREYVRMVINEGKIQRKNLTEEYPNSSEVYNKLLIDSNHLSFIRSKSFDSLQRSARTNSKSVGFAAISTEAISKSSGIIPKSIGAKIKSTVVSQKSTGATRKSSGVISKSIVKTPKSTGALRKSTGSISKTSVISKSTNTTQKCIGVSRKSTGAIPKSTSISQKSTGTIYKSSDVTQKSVDANSKSSSISKKSTGAIPKSTGISQKSTGAIPKSTGVSQKSTGAIPKSTGVSQKSTGAISKSTDHSRKSSDGIPESTRVTQESNSVISKSSSGVEKPVVTSKSKSDKRRKKNRKVPTSEPDLVLVTAHLMKDPKRVGQKSNQKTPISPKSNLTKDSPGPSTASQ